MAICCDSCFYSPAPGNHYSNICLCIFPFSGPFIEMKAKIIWSFATNFFSLSIMSWGFIHVASRISISFLIIAEWYSIGWNYHILFIHSPVMDIWIVSTFGYYGKCCHEYLHTSLFVDICFYFYIAT